MSSDFLYAKSRQVAQTVTTALGHQSVQTQQNRLQVDQCAENQTYKTPEYSILR